MAGVGFMRPRSPTVAMVDPVELGRAALEWYGRRGRRFPWRGERDPYRVLVAAVLLQRTRAEAAAPVYLEFVRTSAALWSPSLRILISGLYNSLLISPMYSNSGPWTYAMDGDSLRAR